MNGDGPFNNRAQGQGSFDRQFVEDSIKKNYFRGKSYQEKIPFYIEK